MYSSIIYDKLCDWSKKAEVTAFTLILYKIGFNNGFDSATTNEKQIFESSLKACE